MQEDSEYVSFDSMAKTYDETRKATSEILLILKNNLLGMISDDIKIKNILEIGCGTGRVSKIFATSGFNVTGIDPSQNMLDIVNKKAKIEGWNFKGVLADARNLPFEENSFDLVFCVNVLHLIKDWQKVISEIIRVSKTNIFANIGLNQYLKGNLWQEYYKKVAELKIKYNENFKLKSETIIGGESSQVLEHIECLNFNFKKFKTNHKTTESKHKVIQGLKYKDISSQRFIPDYIHKETLIFLEDNNYFLEKEKNFVELEEKLLIHIYFKV